MFGRTIQVVAALLVTAAAAPAASYKVESAGPCSLPEVSEAMKRTLQEQGLRVTGEAGMLAEVWIRKVVPLRAGDTPAYSSVGDGVFAGVIHVVAKAGDYRGQVLRPGVYVMRYQTLPADGNHMGVSPTQDYFILTPARADTNPDAVIGFDELMNLSRQAAGTTHPAPLYLIDAKHKGEPTFASDDGHWYLEGKTKAAPAGGAEADFPFAIILIGRGEG